MKGIVFSRFGEPAEVLSLREDLPTPTPGPGQVRVRMIASPINPSDLLTVRGLYGVLPTLPATPGYEGVGVVDMVGSGLLGKLVKGKRVFVMNDKGGNWAEYAVVPARQARPVPSDIPDEQAASFFVNPATVIAMLRHVLQVPAGEWLLQSAANSALGKMIIRFARHEGIRTINVVRRPELEPELKALGADVVLSASQGPLEPRVREITRGKGVRFALDPVGGSIGTQVFECLGQDARMIVYGSLTNQPLQIDPRRMIAGRRIIQSFWLGHWIRERSIPQNLKLFRQIAQLIRDGILTTEVGGTYGLADITAAVRAAESVGKPGKTLLRIGSA